MKFAIQQAQEIERARHVLEALSVRAEQPGKEPKNASEKSKSSPTKTKIDLKAHFSGPPAPPPQAPLPEKPDIARALADPVIQPLLRRSDTARPDLLNYSPTRTDYSGDILRLCEELKLAKGELSTQSERMKALEDELAQEKSARQSAEERAQRSEHGDGERRDSPTDDGHPSTAGGSGERSLLPPHELQIQLDRLNASMDEMKQQMEAYRTRASVAEAERDEARQSLAEMVEQKRRENVQNTVKPPASPTSKQSRSAKRQLWVDGKSSDANGHAVAPIPRSPTSEHMLEHAGIAQGQPITPEQARILKDFLTKEVLASSPALHTNDGNNALLHYGLPYGSFAAVVLLGYVAMTWINGWPPKVER